MDSKEPLEGYATWDLWSGESRSLPFQQLYRVSTMFIEGMRMEVDVRRERDGGANTTSTCGIWQIESIGTSAWRAAKRVLLHVAEAAVAELLLLAFSHAKTCVSNKHAETLLAISYNLSKLLTGTGTFGNAVTVVLPSYGGM